MAKQSRIGLWWDNGEMIVVFSTAAGTPDSDTGLCDTEGSHNDCWPEAAMQFGAEPDDEYFSIPRGRVKYDPKRKIAVIFHGNRTSESRLPLIAEKFELQNWEARKDGHYVI
jgi:beta-phosphoglucomutase-like phosphatase (HAD superfamily)